MRIVLYDFSKTVPVLFIRILDIPVAYILTTAKIRRHVEILTGVIIYDKGVSMLGLGTHTT